MYPRYYILRLDNGVEYNLLCSDVKGMKILEILECFRAQFANKDW